MLESSGPTAVVAYPLETVSQCRAREESGTPRTASDPALASGAARRLVEEEELPAQPFGAVSSTEAFWQRLERDQSSRARRIDNYFFERRCLMDEDVIRRFHEEGCDHDHFYMMDPHVCGAVRGVSCALSTAGLAGLAGGARVRG